MPWYEYACANCGKVHEIIQKFSDPPLEQCPDCGQSVRRLVSRSSFQLKGSGWYATDYKKKASAEASPTKEDTASVASSSAAATSETDKKPGGSGSGEKAD